MPHLWVKDLCVFHQLSTFFGNLLGLLIQANGSRLGSLNLFLSVFSVGGERNSVEAWYTTAFDIEE